MKQKSRTEYSVMNTTVAFGTDIGNFMGFTRVVFTRTLSEGYVELMVCLQIY